MMMPLLAARCLCCRDFSHQRTLDIPFLLRVISYCCSDAGIPQLYVLCTLVVNPYHEDVLKHSILYTINLKTYFQYFLRFKIVFQLFLKWWVSDGIIIHT